MESLIQITEIALLISVVVLFVLVATLIVVIIKKKNEENREKKENHIKTKEENKNVQSNIVQTKRYTTENIKKFLDFDEIKDNMIIQKDGKRLVMVVHCKGINYDLMSGIEKVSVEQGFIQFLNTLTRPIQLHIQSRKVNLEESVSNYNKRLKEIEINYNKIKIQYEHAQKDPRVSDKDFKNIKFEYVRQKNLYEYTKDIISNTEKMSLNKNILTKNYYIVISYYPDNTEDLFQKEELIDLAFSELYTTAQSILRTLSSCGVTGKVMDSVELADLLYVAYNRDSSEVYGIDKAIKAEYDALYTSAPDVIDKKIKELDKVINERALDLANVTIEKVELRSKRQRELERKESQMDDMIKILAKSMIEENRGYISNEIVENSIEEINNIQTEEKPKKSKKGAK